MALLIRELATSRSATTGDKSSEQRQFAADGSSDPSTVKATVWAFAPSTVYDPITARYLPKNSLTLEPQGKEEWVATVGYSNLPVRTPPDSVFKFSTTGGTAKITQAREHISDHARAGETAPNHKGAIGVTGDGKVEGCTIVVPQFSWTETHYMLPAVVDTVAYRDAIELLTGTINSEAFRNWARGEVRFDGAEGGPRSEDDWEITFHFTASRTATLTIDDIEVEKEGWQYLWAEYETQEDTDADRIIQRAHALHLERTYDYRAFALLMIGA